MIRLYDQPLSAVTAARLADLQATVDAIPDYVGQVAEGKRLFALYNKPDNAIFRPIRALLTQMCCGAARCGYCEDSARDQVEHIHPKDFYPNRVFLWENYLYACGRCNRAKLNYWAVFDTSGRRVDIVSPQTSTISGGNLFIDPRSENPQDFLEMDLQYFVLLPKVSISPRDTLRAEYTLEILKLNDRDELLAAREEAYHNYVARLEQYIKRRDNAETQTTLNNLVRSIGRMSHPMVWQEIKRQQLYIPELSTLFAQAVEAFTW